METIYDKAIMSCLFENKVKEYHSETLQFYRDGKRKGDTFIQELTSHLETVEEAVNRYQTNFGLTLQEKVKKIAQNVNKRKQVRLMKLRKAKKECKMDKDEMKGENVEASEGQLDSSGNTDLEEGTTDNPSILEGKIDEDTEDKQSDCMDDQNSEQYHFGLTLALIQSLTVFKSLMDHI